MTAPSRRIFLALFFLVVPLLVIVALMTLLAREPQSANPQADVVVLSYSSFLSEWGPGPSLKKLFKQKTGGIIEFVDAGDSALLIEHLRFRGGRDRVDVVLGLDQLSIPDAKRLLAWRRTQLDQVTWHRQLPVSAIHRDFVPFDWGPMAFVYRQSKIEPPRSLDDLLSAEFERSITLQDPRTSTLGLQFFFWVLNVKGEEAGFEYLKKLKRQLHSVSQSWSTSYGLFKQGQAKLTFSYVTSPVYHQIEEKDRSFRAALFREGQPYQVEYAAIPESCRNCPMAEAFVRFLLTPEAQALVMKKNYMLPVIEGVVSDSSPFQTENLKLVEVTLRPEWFARRRELLERWKELGL